MNDFVLTNISSAVSVKYYLLNSALNASVAIIIPSIRIIHNQNDGICIIVNGVYNINSLGQYYEIATYPTYKQILNNVTATTLKQVQYFV